jgi:tRNA (cytidine/uridine-2'-O-)-methyltransferase
MFGPHVAEQVRLPMRPATNALHRKRDMNLANCAAIATYEAWRQMGFAGGE